MGYDPVLDLLTFNKTDPGSDITVTATRAETFRLPRNLHSWVSKNFGAPIWHREILFEVGGNGTAGASSGAQNYGCTICNAESDFLASVTRGASAHLYTNRNSNTRSFGGDEKLGAGNNIAPTTPPGLALPAWDTTYYGKMIITATRMDIFLYTDPSRTAPFLLATTGKVLTYAPDDSWEVLLAASSEYIPSSLTNSSYFQNFQLLSEDGAIVPPHIFQGVVGL